jgi:flagellar motility protein MotE (MotC chaperone)
MIQLMREFRLVPLVLIAVTCLFVLKVIGLVLEGGYTLGGSSGNDTRRAATIETAPGKEPWAKQMFNFPNGKTAPGNSRPPERAAGFSDITGSVDAKPKEKPPEVKPDEAKKPQEPKPTQNGIVIPLDAKPVSAAERAILERLHERREELEKRARELDMRETLLKAAEQKIETRAGELKETENRITVAQQKKDEADNARLKGLVTMYESMKAKDAAKIFDRLDIRVLVDVATQINPRRMSDILALMSPEAAERLTVEFANRGNGAATAAQSPVELPKIEGRPGG